MDEQSAKNARAQADLATNDARYARIMCRHLLLLASDAVVVDTLRHLVDVRAILGETRDDYIGRLFELEHERARFMDPNHPGE